MSSLGRNGVNLSEDVHLSVGQNLWFRHLWLLMKAHGLNVLIIHKVARAGVCKADANLKLLNSNTRQILWHFWMQGFCIFGF